MSSPHDVVRPIAEPHIKWKHPDGPVIVCSDGTFHWLTLLERLMMSIGALTVHDLNEKHRLDKDYQPG